MNEVEAMGQHSASHAHRLKWAMDFDESDVAERKLKNPNFNRSGYGTVFWNRMLGCSDDGLRVIGPEASTLPGGLRSTLGVGE